MGRAPIFADMIEVIWTAVPVIILIVIAIPSLKLLFMQLDVPKADLTIKATGSQWYWGYEYLDEEDVSFDAIMIGQGATGLNDEVRAELKEYGFEEDEFVAPVTTEQAAPMQQEAPAN